MLEKCEDKIKIPDILICLDNGVMTRDSMWLTSSLRGNINITLKVESLKVGAHSGSAGGVIPDTCRVA